jgi:hypothetical protein
MEHYGRLSRKERRRGILSRKGWIAVGIATTFLAALFLIFRGPGNKKSVPAVQPTIKINLRALSDSLIVESCRSFGLTDSVHINSTSYQSAGGKGSPYRCYKQSWPEGLPFILYAQRLNQMAAASHVQCDCIESTKDGRLDCTLRSGGSIGGQIILEADQKTKLAKREIAIVLTNSGVFTEDELKELLNNGMVLNYLATPDIYPSASIQALLKRGGVTAILRLSAAEEGWSNFRGSSRAGGRRQSSNVGFNDSMVETAFDRHPGTKAIYFDITNGFDLAVVNSILTKARAERIAYFCPNYVPGTIDSLAFSRGLSMVRLNIEPDLKGRALSEIRMNLLNQLLSNQNSERQIICIDAAGTKPGELVALKLFFDKVGIKLRPFMRLADTIDSL